jgi:isoquinoline 1-oxidoreductase subunit beta
VAVGWTAGEFYVRRVVQVLDAGKIINPNGVHQQVEGATMMAMSAALWEEVPLGENRLGVQNFHEYPVVKLKETPQIEVVLLEGLERPYGVGEPPMAPVAPALANAIYDLTGKRIRSLPLLKENLLA